jgi:class 3 adenylate cyclase/tetratricopeptide (TPR) repeat protein
VPASLLRFGGFELDPANFQLRRSGRPLSLERIPLELLLLLVERRGQLVTRPEIAERIWGIDVVLDIDSALNTAIHKVRLALRDNSEHPRYVETVPTKGYRFIGSVTVETPPEVGRDAVIARAESNSPQTIFAVTSPDSDPPDHPVAKPLASTRVLEDQRKHVTVLFADLKGSMELMADRNPEEARKLLGPVLDHMMEAVRRYEGTVNQVMGDGIMALFGAPLAHEDHAVRACNAALWMQESVKRYAEEVRRQEGALIQVRIALNSGEVVVHAFSSSLPTNCTAVGRTALLAARLGQLAAPGSVLITADTLRLAEGYVIAESIGSMTVEGLSEPVDAYEVTGRGAARSRLQAAAARGFSRFVGRETELAQLHRALEQARRGQGQVAAIVGEPGVGKSRLVFELTRSHHLEGWLVLEARSVSYGKAASYLPVIDLLRGYFRIGDRDTQRDIRNKVTGKILTLDRALEPMLPALLALLDVPVEDPVWRDLDRAERRQRTLDAVKRLVLRETQGQPLLMVFEDLHWIDTETQAFLDGLIESLPTAPLLLLVDYRPEYRHAWGSKTYYAQLRLDPLPPESAEELVDALLGPDPSLESFKSRLVERTERNPLFIEESVRSLVETQVLLGDRGAYRLAHPVDTIPVPATVQTTLAWRIDRLPPDEKRLLETAAVIGKDVPFALLHAVIAEQSAATLHRQLGHLRTAEFLYETRLSPDSEYTFKHALTHEVTYGGVLQDRRCALHARIVEAIERLHAGRLAEHVERLAHHAFNGEIWESAVRYLWQAGTKALDRSALQEAAAWFEHALKALEHLPENRTTLEHGFDIHLELNLAVSGQGDYPRMLACRREAVRLAERLGDDRRRGQACVFMLNLHNLCGELDHAVEVGTRALEIARTRGDLPLRILTTYYLEQTYNFRGEFQRAIELAKDNLSVLPAESIYERLGSSAPASVHDRGWLVSSLAQLGQFAAAMGPAEAAIQIAERTHHAYTIGWAHLHAGTLQTVKGNWASARLLFERAIEVFREGQQGILLPNVLGLSALTLACLDESAEAMNRAQEAERLIELLGARMRWAGRIYVPLCQTYLRLSRLEDVERLLPRVLETASHFPAVEAYALHLQGEIAAHPDRWHPEQGENYYYRALAMAEPRGMCPLVAHCHLGLGTLYRRWGQRREARERLTIASTMYREMDMAYWLEQAEEEMTQLE